MIEILLLDRQSVNHEKQSGKSVSTLYNHNRTYYADKTVNCLQR